MPYVRANCEFSLNIWFINIFNVTSEIISYNSCLGRNQYDKLLFSWGKFLKIGTIPYVGQIDSPP